MPACPLSSSANNLGTSGSMVELEAYSHEAYVIEQYLSRILLFMPKDEVTFEVQSKPYLFTVVKLLARIHQPKIQALLVALCFNYIRIGTPHLSKETLIKQQQHLLLHLTKWLHAQHALIKLNKFLLGPLTS